MKPGVRTVSGEGGAGGVGAVGAVIGGTEGETGGVLGGPAGADCPTLYVGDTARVGRAHHPDGLVPVDHVAREGEVLQVHHVGVTLLSTHVQPFGLHS